MKSSVNFPTTRFSPGEQDHRTDTLAVEDPMEIQVNNHSIAVTMRTPGHDFELAAGFLFTEGVVANRTQIEQIRHCVRSPSNVVKVQLNAAASFDPKRLTRHVFTSSSCGICSKLSLEQVRASVPQPVTPPGRPPASRTLLSLVEKLERQQQVFAATGGLHAAALFDGEGQLLAAREDVGRHNAMDKLIGALLLADQLPATDRIVLVSGRASFELVQKAATAGIPVLAAVGAPSSLAVELAADVGLTLIGFLRDNRFNVYSGKVAG